MVSVEELIDLKEEIQCMLIDADIIMSDFLKQEEIADQLFAEMVLGSIFREPKDQQILQCYYDRAFQMEQELASELCKARKVFHNLDRQYFDALWELTWVDE